MNERQFKDRTKQLALRIIRLVDSLPKSRSGDVIGRQLMRCATSVGANYRAACRAKSRKDMAAKLAIVEEEADEALYWLELIGESEMLPGSRLAPLITEMNEILAMVVASEKTLRRGLAPSNRNPKSLRLLLLGGFQRRRESRFDARGRVAMNHAARGGLVELSRGGAKVLLALSHVAPGDGFAHLLDHRSEHRLGRSIAGATHQALTQTLLGTLCIGHAWLKWLALGHRRLG